MMDTFQISQWAYQKLTFMGFTSVARVNTLGLDENPKLSNITRKIEIVVKKHHKYLRIVLVTIINFKVRKRVYS